MPSLYCAPRLETSGDFEIALILACREVEKKRAVSGGQTRNSKPQAVLTFRKIMDKPKRIRRVTVKTERTFVLRSRRSHSVEWCAECGAEVAMGCVDAAAREASTSELAIYKLIEERALHFSEDAEGRILVCLNSLGSRRRACNQDVIKEGE